MYVSHDSRVCASQIPLCLGYLGWWYLAESVLCASEMSNLVDYAHMPNAELNTRYQRNV